MEYESDEEVDARDAKEEKKKKLTHDLSVISTTLQSIELQNLPGWKKWLVVEDARIRVEFLDTLIRIPIGKG